jgi:hypothetical protein
LHVVVVPTPGATFAIGVRDQRPFRVSIESEQYDRQVVVDIAH